MFWNEKQRAAKTKHRHLRALLQLQRVAVLAWHGQSCPLSPSCVVIKNSTGNLVSADISHLPIFTLKPLSVDTHNAIDLFTGRTGVLR